MKNIKLLAGIFLFLGAFVINSCDIEPIDSNIDPNDMDDTCDMPTNFQASGFINNTTISLIWAPGGDEATWTVEYGPVGFAQGTGTSVIVSDPNYTVTGLNSNNSYSFYVKANCNSQSSSDWVGPVTVQAVVNPNCPNPTNFTAARTAADPTDVDLAWQAGGTETSWAVQYGPSGFALGNGTIVSSASPAIQVSNILSNAAYDFYVKANCSSTETSNWVGPLIVQSIETGPCTDPTGFTAIRDSGVTTDVVLDWNPGGAETSWQIQYGVSGFMLGSGTVVASSTAGVTISNIPDANSYQFYVRANCSATENSNWVGPMTVSGNVLPNDFFAKVDNVDFVENYISVGSNGTSPNYITVFGVKNSTEHVGIYIDSSLLEGTYTMTGAATDAVKGQYRFNNVTYTSTAGTVSIVSKTSNRITGSFSFTATYSYTDANNTVVTITHDVTAGTFDVAY